MKKSNIVLSLSMIAGLLAMGQASYAASSQVISEIHNITFTSNATNPSECKAPAAFQYTYTYDRQSGKATLQPETRAGIKWTAIEDVVEMKEQNNVVTEVDYINTFVFTNDIRHPLHVHGHFNAADNSNQGAYWYYLKNGNRCSGNFNVSTSSQ